MAKAIQHPGEWAIKHLRFQVWKGTNSRGHLRTDWMLRIENARTGEFDFATGFTTPDRALAYARTLGRLREVRPTAQSHRGDNRSAEGAPA